MPRLGEEKRHAPDPLASRQQVEAPDSILCIEPAKPSELGPTPARFGRSLGGVQAAVGNCALPWLDPETTGAPLLSTGTQAGLALLVACSKGPN